MVGPGDNANGKRQHISLLSGNWYVRQKLWIGATKTAQCAPKTAIIT